jgi:tetratricopeptide (TPR) repeat protein
MPFGRKPDAGGNTIDFNKVYSDLILPALEDAGLDVIRADEEQRAGEIRKDMFQELLIADLVVADLSIDNPNVWYELGVRHALRARGVVLICGDKTPTAFDVYTDRKLRYSLDDGKPDPTTLEEDRRNLTNMVRATMESWHGRKISPVYNLMPNLQEPDWKSLKVGDIEEYWQQYDEWESKVKLARQTSRIGDLLVLSEETPVAAFRAEAYIRAGIALVKAGHFHFALEQLDKGLEIDPTNLKGQQHKGLCLQRLAINKSPGHSLEKARSHYNKLLDDHPDDAETWALLARVDKDAWTDSWNLEGHTPTQKRTEAEFQSAHLYEAIKNYEKGYRKNSLHYYSGINALTLMYLYTHLTNDNKYTDTMNTMSGAVRFAAECDTDEDTAFWSLSTIGDLEVLTGTPDSVARAYKTAIAKNVRDWFSLTSSRDQLLLLKSLQFNPDNVSKGIEIFDHAINRLRPPDTWEPERIFLFSGHMIDNPDRKTPRFPPDKERSAADKIAEQLDQLEAGPGDLALTQGACGGDILFTEACLDRGVRVHWMQPFKEPDFLKKSVIHGGDQWRQRFYEIKAKLAEPIYAAPDFLGEPPKNSDSSYPYERCNLWLLYTALSYGLDKVNFICLWDGSGGDGPGGTAHMYNEVNRRTGKVFRIDSKTL